MKLQAMAELAASYVNTTNRHIFLTGKAGTGKTTFLKYIVQNTFKKTVIAAPTGIAAINAGGVTLHSLLQLPFGTFIPENIPLHDSGIQLNTPRTLFQKSKFNATKRQMLNEVELLIIDEVSMLRADLLDCIDHTLRYIRRNQKPFGGVQILFIGDLMQLPPVVKDDEKRFLNQFYSSLYFFQSRALLSSPPIHVELKKIFRQQDQDFIDLLNRLRYNEQTDEDLLFLNRYYNPDFFQSEESGYIYLTTHNYKADKLNAQKLQELDAFEYSFHASLDGDFPENMFPTTEELILKEGAQVMFIKNDPSGEGQFFNGKIGTVSSLSDEEIWVRFEDQSEVQVQPYLWENKRYSLDKVSGELIEVYLGGFQQFPIKLAWAVTIHKSQGLTFEKAILDLSDTFAPGQLYVALSRLTSLKGLVLSSALPQNPPKIDSSLSSFNASFEDEQELKSHLENDQRLFLSDLGQNVFDFSALMKDLNIHLASFNKDENRSIKQKHFEWTKELVEVIKPLSGIGESFSNQIRRILADEEFLERLSERVEKAKTYFLDILGKQTELLQEHILTIKKAKKVKAYQKELEELELSFIKKIRDIERISFVVNTLKDGEYKEEESLSQRLVKERGKKRKAKTPTFEVSYKLYKEGKSIKEIAEIRDMVFSTIEGHLAKYVEKGELPLEEFVDSKTIEKIKKVLNSDAVGLAEIKSKLPPQITYGEIKMVIANQKNH